MSTLKTYFGHYFRILHTATDQTMTNALASMELTASQGHIMGYLAVHKSPPCARDLEEAFHLSHPTVSGLLGRLEKKGFIQLRPDEHDRRCKRIYLTDKGEQVLDTMYRTMLETEQRLSDGFAQEELTQFQAYLRRMMENMGEIPCKRRSKEEVTDND